MEDTMLELVKICQEKEFLCIHDNEVKKVVEHPAERGNRSIESLKNFRVIHKSSIYLKTTSQISSIHAVAPILSTKEPEYSLSMGYEHSNTTPKTESDEIIKSGDEELVPILSEDKVTLEDKRECNVPVCENSHICDDHYEIFSDSKNDDDISVYDDDFEDIEYVEASLPDPEIVSVQEENVVYQEEEEVDLEDIFQIQDVDLREKLLSITRLIFNIESLNDNPIPDLVLNSSVSIPTFEERHPFLEELLIDDSILSHESFESNFEDNPSVPRPPPEPPDAEFDARKEIPVVMNDKDEDVDYSSFIFVIYPEMFPLLLSAESEDTIFDPGIFV
nr:hypothetical protein [Tanacetum cinerariifolium]